jgi:hypothetical protein
MITSRESTSIFQSDSFYNSINATKDDEDDEDSIEVFQYHNKDSRLE